MVYVFCNENIRSVTVLRKIYGKVYGEGYGEIDLKNGKQIELKKMRDKRRKSREEFVKMSENGVRI